MKKLLAKSKNNKEVYICETTKEHMKAHLDVNINHIKEAINKIDLEGTFLIQEISLGRTIGKDKCIYVSKDRLDEVKFITRPNRKGTTPMIKAEPDDTDLITIGACVDGDGKWTLFTAFYGKKAPKEPWDIKNEDELKESEQFWSCHALCI